MIDDLDEALRELLTRDLPITSNEVDIAFDQPTREWASRLSRPTLNLFMHDVRENNRLRTQQPYLGTATSGFSATVSPNPVRLDVHYMITAWANDPGDEHRLLGRTLMVLYRYQALPEEFQFGQLADQDFDIIMKVAQYDQRDIRREIWSMLDNEMRPIIDLTVTIAIEPYADWTVPLVRQTEIGFGTFNSNSADSQFGGDRFSLNDQFYIVSGSIHSSTQPEYLNVQLRELAVPVTLTMMPDGRYNYSIRNLRPGTYTVEVWTGTESPVEHPITVPSSPAEYDIYL